MNNTNRESGRNALRQHAEAQRRARTTQLFAQALDIAHEDSALAWAEHEMACRDVMHWSCVADAAFAAVERGAA